MRLLHSAARTQAAFDNENVVSFAGLEPVMRLAQDAGLHDVVGQRVRLGTSIGSNPAGKIATIVAGMIAGADSIDDLDALRHGGMGELFGQVYAPSTLGSFLLSAYNLTCRSAYDLMCRSVFGESLSVSP